MTNTPIINDKTMLLSQTYTFGLMIYSWRCKNKNVKGIDIPEYQTKTNVYKEDMQK